MIITLADYARLRKLDPGNLRRKAASGAFPSAYKMGPIWLIDDQEPYRDRRKAPKNERSRPV